MVRNWRRSLTVLKCSNRAVGLLLRFGEGLCNVVATGLLLRRRLLLRQGVRERPGDTEGPVVIARTTAGESGCFG